MSKAWEFAVSPKQAAIVAACLTFAGLLLSGAGVVAGLLLAPRFPGFEARMAADSKVSVASLPHVAAQPLPKPSLPKLPDATQASPSASPAVQQPPVPAQPEPVAASLPGTGLESSVLAPLPASAAPPASTGGIQSPAPASASIGLVAAASTPSPAAGMALKPASLPIQMTVRVGSFSIEENARNFVERLSRFGYHALDIPGTDAHGRRWNVVQVGPYAAYDDASKAAMELSAKYRLDPIIIPVTTF
jgi:cell division septation protein DedD